MCRGEGSCTVSKSLLRRSWSGRDFGRPYTMVHPYTAPGSLSRVRNRPVLGPGADLVVTTASQVMRSAQRDMRRPLSGGGFRAVTGGGPTDVSGTAYPASSPIARLNNYFAQTKEDPQCAVTTGPICAQTPGRPASFPQNQRRDECCSDRRGRVTKRQSGSCPSITISAFVGTYLVRLPTRRTSGPFGKTGRITFG